MTRCLEPDGVHPCQFAGYCKPERQAIQQACEYRGMECVFYQGYVQDQAYRPAEQNGSDA